MQLELIPLLDACDFPTDIEDELAGKDISTHYQCDILSISFESRFPLLEKWLIETYGEDVKQHSQFAILAT